MNSDRSDRICTCPTLAPSEPGDCVLHAADQVAEFVARWAYRGIMTVDMAAWFERDLRELLDRVASDQIQHSTEGNDG